MKKYHAVIDNEEGIKNKDSLWLPEETMLHLQNWREDLTSLLKNKNANKLLNETFDTICKCSKEYQPIFYEKLGTRALQRTLNSQDCFANYGIANLTPSEKKDLIKKCTGKDKQLDKEKLQRAMRNQVILNKYHDINNLLSALKYPTKILGCTTFRTIKNSGVIGELISKYLKPYLHDDTRIVYSSIDGLHRKYVRLGNLK